jgi:tRNA A-37 threonylcarbamoyl transferase component Bud32
MLGSAGALRSRAVNARQPAFLEARAGGLRIVHRADVDPALVVQAIARHRENAAQQLEGCEAYGPGSSVSRVVLGGRSRELDLAVKWNHWRGWRGALSDLFNGSRATRARLGAERLRAVGIPHPETLALAERRRLGLVTESFILTRFLGGAEPLPAVLPEIRRSPPQRRRLAYAVGDVVGMLHAAGLDHSDLKHSNLLVTAEWRIVLLDLDSLARPRRPTWRRRVRALGQLEAFASDLYPWLPRTDRARFLRAYFRHQPELCDRRRELVRAVTPWVERRLERWARQVPRRHIQYPLAPREEPGSGEESPGPLERVEPA